MGRGEASFLTSTLLGEKFSFVIILENERSMIEEQVRRIGLHDRLASIRVISMTPREMEMNLQRMEDSVRKEADQLSEKAGRQWR